MAIHRGTELNNISETWNENERNRGNDAAGSPGSAGNASIPQNDLERAIKEEAAEYDNANKEDRLLGGERATVRDDEGSGASDE